MKKTAIFILCLAILLSGCFGQRQNGFLAGKISIGPICPVERNPPDPNCQPTLETFKAWPVGVYSGFSKVAILSPDSSGNYKIELAPGKYTVKLDKQQRVGGSKYLPADVTIESGGTTTLDINLDTGIR